MADISIPTSRLLRNSEALREQLEARNIYAPDTAYPLQNAMYTNNVVNSINTIIAGLTPFKSYNLKNTVIGRLVTTQTPLSEIGLEMLGKQFLLNSMSHLAQQTFPIIKPTAWFDNNKDTRVITFHKDLRITKTESPSEIGTFLNNFIDTILYKYPVKNYPFSKYSQNSDYLRNSGKGQLEMMYNSMNQNIYKPSNYSDSDNTFYSVATEHAIKVMPVSSVLGGNDKNVGQGEDDKKFFDFRNIYGEGAFTDRLRSTISNLVKERSSFLYHLAYNTINTKSPKITSGNIKPDKSADILDLKSAVNPIIMFARTYSLQNNIWCSNTIERLHALKAKQIISEGTIDEIIFGYNFLMKLRLRNQALLSGNQQPLTNTINTRDLIEIEVAVLKKVLSLIPVYQSKISIDFRITA